MGKMIYRMFEDLDSFISRDPAARNRLEVFLCYPGYHSILFYRFANALWRRRFFLLGRLISNFGKIFTGIEIHPGSTIGRRLFIDHGNGIQTRYAHLSKIFVKKGGMRNFIMGEYLKGG